MQTVQKTEAVESEQKSETHDVRPYRDLASTIALSVSESERAALGSWIAGLLAVRASSASAASKAKRALELTYESRITWPIVKLLGREIRYRAWDDRGLAARLGLGGAAIGLLVFGGQGAGIAALGTAVGVPLWVVLGSGAAFAGVLIDELHRTDQHRPK